MCGGLMLGEARAAPANGHVAIQAGDVLLWWRCLRQRHGGGGGGCILLMNMGSVRWDFILRMLERQQRWQLGVGAGAAIVAKDSRGRMCRDGDCLAGHTPPFFSGEQGIHGTAFELLQSYVPTRVD